MNRMRLVVEGPFPFEKDKFLSGVVGEVCEEGDGSDIDETVVVKIGCDCFSAAVDGIEPGLFELEVSFVQVYINSVVGFQDHGVVSVVAGGVYDIREVIFIDIGQLEAGGAVDGGKAEDVFCGEASFLII